MQSLTQFWESIFITSCLLVFYNYAGYALLAVILTKIRGKRAKDPAYGIYPSVSFIVPAYNEEAFIDNKIQNSLSLDYPENLIEYIFISDGSTDKTSDIISRHDTIRHMFVPERSGKSAALNRAVKAATNDILIINDANTILNKNALKEITRHYSDEQVGGVAGEKKVVDNSDTGNKVGGGEGIYWKYESLLKKIDSSFYSVVGAAGELFSVRRNLFEPVSSEVILDDFIISLKVAEKGYRIIYEPNAYATELPSFSIKDERKRKTRIAAGGFQSMVMLKSLLKFWRHPKLTFLYISHRVMRWTTSPICMILAFVSNFALLFGERQPFYQLLFVFQILIYSFAIIGSLRTSYSRVKIFRLPFYFVFMNLSVVQGFVKFLKGKQSAVWEKAERSSGTIDINKR